MARKVRTSATKRTGDVSGILATKPAGRYSKSINGDAFANETHARAIEIIKNEMGGPIDLMLYSLA